MRKVFHSIISHLPIIGGIYKLQTKPMFCSMGMNDGAYDYVLKLIEKYRKQHPHDQITNQLIQKLIEEDKKKKEG